jgi:uncharacterized membrane protein YesL
VTKFFNPDSPVMSFLSDTLDFIVLNVLALACALPVLTAGASFSALSGVMTANALQKAPIRARDFFVRFRAVFLRATLSWVILLVLLALFFFNMRISATMPSVLRLITVSVLLFFLLCACITAVFLFPMLSFSEHTPLPGLWRGAFFVAVAKLPRSLLMVLLHSIPVLLFLFLPRVFIVISPVWVSIWFSLVAFLCAKIGGRWYLSNQNSR